MREEEAILTETGWYNEMYIIGRMQQNGFLWCECSTSATEWLESSAVGIAELVVL